MENPKIEKQENPGVLEVKVENNHYIVTVMWKDGIKSQVIFPVIGLKLFDSEGNMVGKISGEKARLDLEKHSMEYGSCDDFSHIPYLNEKNN